MTVAIHQPNYLPWLGYFYKIYKSDVFVFHDAVQFSKASYTKRCRIRKEKTGAETEWLSVPLKAHRTNTAISEIEVSHVTAWPEKHWRKINNAYAGAPYFSHYATQLENMLGECQKTESLASCNILLVKEMMHILGLGAALYRSSEMQLTTTGAECNLEIVAHFQGDRYLAGKGSRNYEDPAMYLKHGIQIEQHDLGHWLSENPYATGSAEWIAGLSVIDALMYIGAEGIRSVFDQYRNAEQG